MEWITSDGQGNIYAAWFDARLGSIDSWHASIVVRISRDRGRSWEPEIVLTTQPDGIFPILRSNGSVVIASWEQYVDPNIDRTVYRTSVDEGRSWSEPRVATDSSLASDFAVLNDGMVFAWWATTDIIARAATFSTPCAFEPPPPTPVLLQSYPNPVHGTATIRYLLPVGTNRVVLSVYNILGELVTVLERSDQAPAGPHELTWTPSHLPTGIYFYRLTAGSLTVTSKLVLLR
jgi:hypothetical protein